MCSRARHRSARNTTEEKLRFTVSARKEAVTKLHDQGLSQRQIAKAVGKARDLPESASLQISAKSFTKSAMVCRGIEESKAVHLERPRPSANHIP